MVLLASTVTFLLALPLLHQRVAVYLAYVVNALDLTSAVQLARFSTYWQALRWICVLASILAEFCVLPWPIDGDRLRTFLLAWSFDLAIVVLCERFTSRSSRTRDVSDPEDSPPGVQDQHLATRNSVELDAARGKISLEKPTLDDLEEPPYLSLVGFVLALAREWFADEGSRLLRRLSDACLPLPSMIALLVRMSDWIPVTHAAAGDARGEEGAGAGLHYLDALDCANELVRRWFADSVGGHVLARAKSLVSAPVLWTCVPACILAGFFVIPDPRPINGELVVVGLSGLSVILSIGVVRGRFARCFTSGRGKEKGIVVPAGEDAVPLQGAQDEDNLAVNGVSGKAPQPSVGELSAPSILAPIIAGLPLPNSSSSRGSPSLNSRRPPEVDGPTYERLAKKPRLQAPQPHELDVFNRNNALRKRKRKQHQQRVLRFAGVGRLHGHQLRPSPSKNREQLEAGGGGVALVPALEQALASAEPSVPAFPPSPRLAQATHCSERSIDATAGVHRNAEKSLAPGSELESDSSAGPPFRDILDTPPPRKVKFAPIGDLHRSVAHASPAQSGSAFSEKLPAQRAEMKETRLLARGGARRWAAVGEPDVLGGAGEQERSLQHNMAHLAMGAGVDHGPGGGRLVQGGRNAKDRKGKGKAPERKGGRGGERTWLVQMSEVRDLDVEDASSDSFSASSGDTGEW